MEKLVLIDSNIMGNVDVLFFWIVAQNLSVIIIYILTLFSSKNLLNRFNVLKKSRRDFYECGFRPSNQKPINISIQFIFICVFFIIYDIELVFSFPLVSSNLFNSYLDFFGFFLIYFTMIISLLFDNQKNLLNWKFS